MALTEIPSELSSTPSIVDNGNATAITIGSDESATFAGAISVAGNLRSASFSVGAADLGEALNILDGGHTGHGATNTVSLASFGENVSGNSAGVWLGSMTNETTAVIGARTATGNIAFQTYSGGWGERMRLSAAGDLLVGKSGTAFGTAGIALRGTVADFTRDGGTPINVNRLTGDGSLIDLHKNSSLVGSIGVLSNRLYAGTGDTGFFFSNTTNAIHPWNTTSNSARDAGIDLGASDRRFKDLYLSGGVYLGGTGAANKLSDVETGNWTPTVSVGTATLYLSQWYVKVGSLVTCYFYMYNFTQSTGTSSFVINGLPFPKAVNHESYFSIAYGGTPSLPSNVSGVFGRIGQNGTNSIGVEIHRSAATSTVMNYTHSSGGHFAATFSYRTSA